MLCANDKASLITLQKPIIPLAFTAIFLTVLLATNLQAQTVATYSFEDATADGWTSFDGASSP